MQDVLYAMHGISACAGMTLGTFFADHVFIYALNSPILTRIHGRCLVPACPFLPHGVLAMTATHRLLLSALFAATTWFSLPAQAAEPMANPRAIVKEDASPHDFATTVSRLKAQLAKDGWNLLTEIDLGGRIAKRGVQLPGGLVILELTSGGSTIPLLKNEATRYVAGMMPCGVSVYALDNGQVMVSRMNAGLMLGAMEPQVADVLGKSMAKLDASIAAALSKE